MRCEKERRGEDKIRNHSWKERGRDRQGRTDKEGETDRQTNFWDREAAN